jgi:hypothetical protein
MEAQLSTSQKSQLHKIFDRALAAGPLEPPTEAALQRAVESLKPRWPEDVRARGTAILDDLYKCARCFASRATAGSLSFSGCALVSD